MEALVRDREIIFNLAGQVSHIDSMRDPHTDLEINCRAQLSMLEACRKSQPGRPRRLRRHAAGLRPSRSPAGGRVPPGAAGRHQRRQQGRRRVLPPALQQRLRRSGLLASADQRLRAPPADPAQPPGLHRLVHPARDRGQGDPGLRRWLAAARLRVRRRCGGRVLAGGRGRPLRRRSVQRRRRRTDQPRDLVALLLEVAGTRLRAATSSGPRRKSAIDIGSFYSDSSKFRRAVGWAPRVDLRTGWSARSRSIART